MAVFLIALAIGMPQVFAAAEEIVGAWELTTTGIGWQAYGTLSIAKNVDGTLTGRWGSMDLTNVKFDDQRLSFTRTAWAGNIVFSGPLKDGTLVLSSGRGGKVTGVRRKAKSPVLGHWDLKYHLESLAIPARLIVWQRPGGPPEARWINDFAQTVVSSVKIEGDKLTLSQQTMFDNTAFESTLQATVNGHTLTGAIQSPLGDTAVTAQRVGTALIGKWELTLVTPEGQRTHVLTIDTDLTGRYERPEAFGGEVPIQDLKLDGDQATFQTEVDFGDRINVTKYTFQLEGTALRGQSVSPRGIVELTGKQIEPTPFPTSTK